MEMWRNGGDVEMMCGNEQAAPWCLVLKGNKTAATESEADTLQLHDVAADVGRGCSAAAQHIFSTIS